MRSQWVKQLTRENTLLDRAFRTIAYKDSVKEIGKAVIAKSPVIGFGRVTSLYYDPVDYKKQQLIILEEFSGDGINRLGNQILGFLEDGYKWAKSQQGKGMSKPEFLRYFKQFMTHHAHSRGAITYGYWGEPVITSELKKTLKGKVKESEMDKTISALSVPQLVSNTTLSELHGSSPRLIKERAQLLQSLNLNGRAAELVEILSWFTLFYELGERVSSFMFDEFMNHLRKIVPEQKLLEELEWYDPDSLFRFFSENARLGQQEISRRKKCFILDVVNDKLEVTSGDEAVARYQKEFEEKIDIGRIKEIRGTVASVGKVKGRVKIVITQDDQKKMNEGDILISTMTTPRLMTAMKKASAIVTDEGGLTAHAAIVARELSTPCIVGTKIATKMLKDGDMVEVDAEKGIVTLLNLRNS